VRYPGRLPLFWLTGADFVELNLNGIRAPSPFSDCKLEAVLMQTIKITRPVE